MQTSQIMKANRQVVQQKYQNLLTWELYNWQYYGRKGRPIWLIHDGPPFASGKAHIGILYNKTLKDIINRYKLLRGYRVHFIPGFDCYGTTIEDLALSNESKNKVGTLKLSLKTTVEEKTDFDESPEVQEILRKRQQCREFVKSSILSQMQDYIKWGIMTDWRYSYFTMMPDYECMVLDSFARMVNKKQIFRGSRAVFWSTASQRIMDENQIEEVKELINCAVAKFPILEFGKSNERIKSLYPQAKLLVFCTEPWKLMGTNAVAINEKIQYALIKADHEYLILAEKRIGEFKARSSTGDMKTLLMIPGEQLKEMILAHPLVSNRQIPTVIYNEVKSSYGTGINAIAPGHDIESLKVASVYNLDKAGCVDQNGKMLADLGSLYAGLDVKNEKTNQVILKMLQSENALYSSFKYQNVSYKDNKTGEKIIMLTVDSWFVRITDKLKMRCLQELAHVKYSPKLNLKTTEETHEDYETLKKQRMKHMDFNSYYYNIVEEINEFNDWCISENSVWGIPIPFFIRKDTNEVLMDNEIIQHVSEVFKKHGGSDAWYKLPIFDLLPKRFQDQADKLIKGNQVFDVWYDNAFSWNFILNEQNFHENNQLTVDIQNKISELNQSSKTDSTLELEGSQPKKPSFKDYLAQKRSKKQQSSGFDEEQLQNQSLLATTEANFAKIFPKELLTQLDEENLVNLRLQAQSFNAISGKTQPIFPANMFLEGFDQHSRWFLSSLVLSMALTDSSPFKVLKTHGIFVDDNGDKISKSVTSANESLNIQEIEDFLEGSYKQDGSRKFGYGIDIMRAWCAFKDSDKNMFIDKEQLEKVSKEIKVFRDVIRVILSQLQAYDVNENKFDFEKLTIVDKMMMIKLLEFSQQVTDAFDKFDLRLTYDRTMEFVIRDVVNFYFEFAKQRKSSYDQYASSLMVLNKLFNCLLLSSAPIICFSSQEAFDHMPNALFNKYEKPVTVFQMPWFNQEIMEAIDSKFLAKFEIRDSFNLLLSLRSRLRETYDDQILPMLSKKSPSNTELHFVVKEIDSNEASILELLENDLSDFFFGAKVIVETREQNEKNMKNIAPLKTMRQQFDVEQKSGEGSDSKAEKKKVQYNFKIRVYRKSEVIKEETIEQQESEKQITESN